MARRVTSAATGCGGGWVRGKSVRVANNGGKHFRIIISAIRKQGFFKGLCAHWIPCAPSATAVSSDNDAFAVGLTCGGILDLFVEKVSQQTSQARRGRSRHRGRQPGSGRHGGRTSRPQQGRDEDDHPASSPGSLRADAATADDVRGLLAAGKPSCSRTVRTVSGAARGCASLQPATRPRPRMLVFGPSTSQPLSRARQHPGVSVIVCDA